MVHWDLMVTHKNEMAKQVTMRDVNNWQVFDNVVMRHHDDDNDIIGITMHTHAWDVSLYYSAL